MSASRHIEYGMSTSAHAMMAIKCPITLRFLNYLSYAKLERSKSGNFDILMVFKTQFPPAPSNWTVTVPHCVTLWCTCILAHKW